MISNLKALAVLLALLACVHPVASADSEEYMLKAEFTGENMSVDVYEPKRVQAIMTYLEKEQLHSPDPNTTGNVLSWVVVKIFKGKSMIQRVELYSSMDSTGMTLHTTPTQRHKLLELLRLHAIMDELDASANYKGNMSK